MLGKKIGTSEIVLTNMRMFILSFGQQVIEFIWQGTRKDITQATVFTEEKEQEQGASVFTCRYTAHVHDRGILMLVQLEFRLFPSNRLYEAINNVWGWIITGPIFFQIRSVSNLRNICVGFDLDAIQRPVPKVLCTSDSEQNLRTVWRELGLDPNAIVRTWRNEND